MEEKEDIYSNNIGIVSRQTTMSPLEIRNKLKKYNNDAFLVLKEWHGLDKKKEEPDNFNASNLNQEIYKQFRKKLYIKPTSLELDDRKHNT